MQLSVMRLGTNVIKVLRPVFDSHHLALHAATAVVAVAAAIAIAAVHCHLEHAVQNVNAKTIGARAALLFVARSNVLAERGDNARATRGGRIAKQSQARRETHEVGVGLGADFDAHRFGRRV